MENRTNLTRRLAFCRNAEGQKSQAGFPFAVSTDKTAENTSTDNAAANTSTDNAAENTSTDNTAENGACILLVNACATEHDRARSSANDRNKSARLDIAFAEAMHTAIGR